MELAALLFIIGLILWPIGFFRRNYFAAFLGFLCWAYSNGILSTITDNTTISYFSMFAAFVSSTHTGFMAREFITAKDNND